jgi:hypothetical protein
MRDSFQMLAWAAKEIRESCRFYLAPDCIDPELILEVAHTIRKNARAVASEIEKWLADNEKSHEI